MRGHLNVQNKSEMACKLNDKKNETYVHSHTQTLHFSTCKTMFANYFASDDLTFFCE